MSAKWLAIGTLRGVGIGALMGNITLGIGIGIALGIALEIMQRPGDR